MAKKRKITAWVIVCLLWEALVVGVHIFMRSQLKFPALNFELFGWLVPVFMAVPFIALFLGVLSIDRKKLMRVLAKTFAIIGILVYLFYMEVVTGGFEVLKPGIYPLMSETNDIEDYLVLDGDFLVNRDKIIEIMPDTLPAKATNIVYNYKYEPAMYGCVNILYTLPKAEYEAFKIETLKKDGSIEETDNGIKFISKWSNDGFCTIWSELTFDDSSYSIKYIARESYAC